MGLVVVLERGGPAPLPAISASQTLLEPLSLGQQDSKDQRTLCLRASEALVAAVQPLNGPALSPLNNLSDELQPAFAK